MRFMCKDRAAVRCASDLGRQVTNFGRVDELKANTDAKCSEIKMPRSYPCRRVDIASRRE